MTEKEPVSKKGISADWLLRGALTKIGDTFDRLTGRRWVPSSSLATSELIERIRKLLDNEARHVDGKGMVVPHNIKLKMQWDKFSTDADESLNTLKNALLTAAADHINDALYYTYAPLSLEVKPDYFTEGVKLFASFDKFADEDQEVEMNVTIPAINLSTIAEAAVPVEAAVTRTFIARFEVDGGRRDKQLIFSSGGRLSVGRTSISDLVVNDPSVSKIHASLVMDREGNLSVADTGSTNGTFINGQRISYGKAIRLEDGDRVRFGSVEIVFERITPAPVTEVIEKANSKDETLEIDGFEFTSKAALPNPVDSAQAVTLMDEPPEPAGPAAGPETDAKDVTDDQPGPAD